MRSTLLKTCHKPDLKHPSLLLLRRPCVSQIMEYAYKHNQATLRPEPSDKEAFVRSLTYSTDYDEFVVDSYRWPEDSVIVQSCKL